MRDAVRRGAMLAAGLVAAGYGVSLFRPSIPPRWTVLIGGSLALGALYTGLVYSGVWNALRT